MKKIFSIFVVATLGLVSCNKGELEEFPVEKLTAPPYLNAPNEREIVNQGKYPFKYWEIDDPVETLSNYRTSNNAFVTTSGISASYYDASFVPSRDGLETLKMSGSNQLDETGMRLLLAEIRKVHTGNIVIVDLRSEIHGYFNGKSVCMNSGRGWGNMGNSISTIISSERDSLLSHLNQEIRVYSNTEHVYQSWNIQSVYTEEDLCRSFGLLYKRIPAHDNPGFPCDATLDEFIAFVRNLSANTWVHFHCAKGKGRTSLYMVLYDLMKNPDLTLNDIVYRQYMLGGQFVMNDGSTTTTDWKKEILYERSLLLPVFYDYVKKASLTGFSLSYSEWKKQTYK